MFYNVAALLIAYLIECYDIYKCYLFIFLYLILINFTFSQ